MIWAAMFGYMVFSEIPDTWTWVGATVIVVATTIIAHRERKSRPSAGSQS